MKISTQHINSFPPVNAYSEQNGQADQQLESLGIVEQPGISFLEEMKLQENLKIEPREDSVLDGREKATLHALFGSEKPSEMIFYGRTQLQHIHKGQLLNIKA